MGNSKFFSLRRLATRDCQMCCGTIGMPTRYSMLACGVLVVMATVLSSGAVTVLKFVTSEPFAVAAVLLCITRLNVHATSLAVSGLPSLHFKPLCRWKVQVSLSGDVLHESAR